MEFVEHIPRKGAFWPCSHIAPWTSSTFLVKFGGGECILLITKVISSSKTLLLFIYFFCLFRASPTVHGGSQARGQSGAAAASPRHSHSNARSKQHLQPTPQLMAMPDPEPTEGGQGLNPHPHDTSQICFCWAMMGTPKTFYKFKFSPSTFRLLDGLCVCVCLMARQSPPCTKSTTFVLQAIKSSNGTLKAHCMRS